MGLEIKVKILLSIRRRGIVGIFFDSIVSMVSIKIEKAVGLFKKILRL